MIVLVQANKNESWHHLSDSGGIIAYYTRCKKQWFFRQSIDTPIEKVQNQNVTKILNDFREIVFANFRDFCVPRILALMEFLNIDNIGDIITILFELGGRAMIGGKFFPGVVF